ncbi:hypothetical protein ABIB30_005261 [Pedobacter sp. UYP1]
MQSKKVLIFSISYRECEIPLFLAYKKYADFNSSYDDGFQTLAKVFGIKDTETLSIANWRTCSNRRDIDWKLYKNAEFENLVNVLVNRVIV